MHERSSLAASDLTCAEAEPLIPLAADGELDAPRREALARHLADCVACREREDALAHLRSRIRADAPRFAAPPALRARVATAAAQADAGSRTAPAVGPSQAPPGVTRDTRAGRRNAWRWRWLVTGAVAGMVATILVTLGAERYADWRASSSLAVQAVDAHVHASLTQRVIEVASSDRHTVKPWLSARLDYSPPVPDAAPDGSRLIGGRVDSLHGRAVATLVYGVRLHVIDVFVQPAGDEPSALDRDAIRGFNLVRRQAAGMDWLAVSDLDARELGAFMDALARAAAPP